MSKSVEDGLQSTIKSVKKALEKPENKNALIVGVATYLLSENNKERNTALASIAAYFLTPKDEDTDED